MAIGPDSDEWLVQFDVEEDMLKWVQKVRKRCKRLRKSKISLSNMDVNKIIEDNKKKVPVDHPALQRGPEKEWKEEEWIRSIQEIWDVLRNWRRDMTEIALFCEYYTTENARFLNWFISPGASESSLEKDLLTAEDIFVVLQWRERFVDFKYIESQVESGSMEEKPKLIQHCKYMMHLIDMYNLYHFEIQSRDPEYGNEKAKWDLYIQRIEGIIDQDQMRKQQNEKEAEEKRNIWKNN